MSRRSMRALTAVWLSVAVVIWTGCPGDSPSGPGTDDVDAPLIVLSPSTQSFTATEGGANPGAGSVSVANGGGGSLTGLSASISYTSGSGWLSASLNVTTAPATVTVQPTTGSLPVGSYEATISVASPAADNSPRTVDVSFTVEAAPEPPSISLSESSRTFQADEGGSDPSAQTVSVTNTGGGSLTGLSATISYTSGSGWLSASLNSTTAPATLTIQPTTGSLSAGTYEATISVASSAADNSPQTVDVTFTVQGTLAAPVLSGPSTSTGSFTLTWTYDFTPCALCSSNDGYRLEESTTSSTAGYSTIYDSFNMAERTSPKSVGLNRSAGTYWYRVRAYDATGGGWTPYSNVVQVTVSTPARAIRIINNMSEGLNIHEVVQVKIIAPNTTFTRDDRLTDDPAQCLTLPGQSIPAGGDGTFAITIGDAYWVFIGIGIWDLDNFFCPSSSPWFKRRFFTDLDFNTWYVWTEVHVTGHSSGTWDWTIGGSYLNGTLAVTPAGSSPIPFNVTSGNPIP